MKLLVVSPINFLAISATSLEILYSYHVSFSCLIRENVKNWETSHPFANSLSGRSMVYAQG